MYVTIFAGLDSTGLKTGFVSAASIDAETDR